MIPHALKQVVRRHPRISDLARRLMAAVPMSMRLGKNFWAWYAFFADSETWTANALAHYQLTRLRELLTELKRTSPFYQTRLAEMDPTRINSLEEFAIHVPHLTRSEFGEYFPQLLSSEWRQRRLKKNQTSGTTGSALQFYHEADDDQREWAAICHQWKRVGYDPARSRRAEFRGLTRAGCMVDHYPDQNMLRCSILHLQASSVRQYAEAIRSFGAEFIHGYPSAVYLLARAICDHGIKFPQPTAVLLASEQVYAWQLDQIAQAFPQAKLFAHYGCAERTVLAAWCEHRREYHVLPQYGIVEVDLTNSEIIGTNLFNTINGFVRYRMSDTAQKTVAEPCPDCGRAYSPRLLEVSGRLEDYLFSPQHGWIPPAIVTYALKTLRQISNTQIVQRERDAVSVLYTVAQDSDAEALGRERDEVATGLRRLLGDDMKIHFARVDDFPRSATGKFPWIVCELDKLRSGHNLPAGS